ncbi:MAG: peptide chain release factor N(5)-glutamine methyltransferase, partial [archaeon]|nr:peptide chain release factor N(5)-glutamine methyltransferase [archaeon]
MESEKSSMDSTVLDYEPASALFVPDSDPLRFYRRIAELRLGTWLYFEINEQKGAAVCDLLASLGYVDIEIKKDSYGKERMVRARLAR